ncbi:MAG: tRNA lysidine(34) synthetase TilS [Bacteroidota bacterium]
MNHKILKNFSNKIDSIKKSNFLVAVSGGVDSMVLASLFKFNNINFSIAHCNFQLREEDSNSDEKFVIEWCKAENVKIFVKRFNTRQYCKENKLGIQEGARNLRYSWFKDLFKEYRFNYIVTAHHLDDQLETFLINATRGSGLNGLIGIPNESNFLFRPLLDELKFDIIDYAKQNNIEYREDISNNKNNYFRNIIRNSVIPIFKDFDDNVMLKFKTTLNNLNSTKIFVDSIIENTKKDIFITSDKSILINIDKLKTLKPLDFFIHNLFNTYGFDYKEVIKIFDSESGKFLLSKTHKIKKSKNNLILTLND